jgi:hypothetical protein
MRIKCWLIIIGMKNDARFMRRQNVCWVIQRDARCCQSFHIPEGFAARIYINSVLPVLWLKTDRHLQYVVSTPMISTFSTRHSFTWAGRRILLRHGLQEPRIRVCAMRDCA